MIKTEANRTACMLCVLMSLGALGDGHAGPKSGLYDSLILGFDPGTRILTGYFQETRRGNGTDEAPQFSCAFALLGTVDGEGAPIATWFPEDDEVIAGAVTLGEDSVALKLTTASGGCAMVVGDLVTRPYVLRKIAEGTWTSVRVVRSTSAALHVRPTPTPVLNPRISVKEGDGVVVFSTRDGWVNVGIVDDEVIARGWMREVELYSASPGN